VSPDEDDPLFAEIHHERRATVLELLVLVIVAALGIAALFIRCGHGAPDQRPAPVARIHAHLDAIPPITIAGRVVTLVAWLDDPEAQVRCPSVEWTWEDGTRSAHTADCDPDERVTRHQEIKRGTLGRGEHRFVVTFAAAGRQWRAERGVQVV